ncbi:hypothetical protein CYLTODRAFT_457065 [Cylindrobasidium torrendii FP15055 ss-10]|uniref:DUF1690-domain-containing protein n=1 Tax=Cylindrobasidium torrendii FP15055 ss-10 TaxID=1314674 RepID=A0A0D7B1U2_9AGAR|nr:hypothetical protein CYLTODRAFT_457065 [Cylindrobasidium torrendii FP15055 ss-10]
MGASQSKSEEKVFTTETPISFSPDVVDRLAANVTSSEVPAERQLTLDGHVRARIQAEMARLRKEEEEVRAKIEAALEKENLDREKTLATDGDVKDSASLLNDLEEIKAKVERFQERKALVDYPELKGIQEKVLACYRNQPTRTLDCWREVNQFKVAVDQLEQKFVKSLQ